MRWERDPPCLVLQYQVVSILTTIDKVNDHGMINGKRKANGVWNTREVST